MDKTMNGINFRTIIKLVILWIIITIILFLGYTLFTATKKVQFRGVLVEKCLISNVNL